jgi:hypothetical protein
MCQRRPADPTDPGDAADLSIMGYAVGCQPQPLVPGSARFPVAHSRKSI